MRNPNLLISIPVLAGVLAIGTANPLRADDTDIYFGSAASGSVVKANVLLVLDTSSSMDEPPTPNPGDPPPAPPPAPQPKNKLEHMKDALREIIGNANNVNIGLMTFHRRGGPVRYPVADLDAPVSEVEGAATLGEVFERVTSGVDDAEQFGTVVDLGGDALEVNFVVLGAAGTTVQVRVNNNTDDAEERIGFNAIHNSTDLELIKDLGDQQVGMRFVNVDIPQGATITKAEVEFVIDEKRTETTNLTIFGQAADSPSTFVTGAPPNVSSRTKTAASVAWPNPLSPNVGEKLLSPDISPVIQEIVCRGAPAAGSCAGTAGNWVAGNDLVLVITGTSGSRRTVVAHNGSASNAPLLRVTYTDPTAGGASGDQLVGLRFPEVEVPQGAKITSAVLEFNTTAPGSDDVVTRIQAQKSADAPPFEATINNLTAARPRTGAFSDWDLTGDPWASADEVKQSIDISTVVQEVVDQADWCGGNAMAFFLETQTSGLARSVRSFEGQASAAPALRLEYDPDSSPTGCIRQRLQTQISASFDDAEENVSTGDMSLTSSDLEMVYDGADQLVGMRFRNLLLPQGADVLEAFIRFKAKNPNAADTDLTIRVQNIGDAPAFTTSTDNISDRPLTGAVAWDNVQAWGDGQVDQTPDLTDLVKAIVDRADWAPGNDMVFVISDSGGSGPRRAWSFDGEAAASPVLHVRIAGSAATAETTVRERLLDLVDEIAANSGTPIVDTLYEAARYYRGEGVDYGATRGDGGINMEKTRVSHPASFTGGTIVHNPVCDQNPNDVLCSSEVIEDTPDAVYKSPISLECQKNYIVLLSDGEPTELTAQAKIETLISGDTGEAFSCTGAGDARCGVDLLKHLYEFDQSSAFDDKQNIVTHTIGFDLEGGTFMPELAAQSSPEGGPSEGRYFTAKDGGSLVTAFEAILTSVLDTPTSFAAPSVSVNAFNKLFHRDEIYFSLFEPSLNKAWPGNAKKFKVCEANPGDTCTLGEILDARDPALAAIGDDTRIKATAQSFWAGIEDGAEVKQGGAGSQIPNYSFRKIYTFTGATPPDGSPVVDLTESVHALEVGNAALTADMLGAADATEREALINWIRGQDVDDEDTDTITTENRWSFADPLHGSTVAVTYGCVGVAAGGTCAEAADDITKLFVGSNDGSIRMLNAETGEEEWAFFPPEMLGIQKDLRFNLTGKHVYGMDSTPTVLTRDNNNDGIIDPGAGDFVRVFFSMRRGGSNIYALDVTPDTDELVDQTTGLVTPEFMWEIQGGGEKYSHLGQTWSRPLLADIRAKKGFGGPGESELKTVLIFAGGYDEAQDATFGTSTQGNAVFIADAETGERIWWASGAGALDGQAPTPQPPNLELAGMDYPIPSDVSLLDSNGDGATDRVYVGDLGGQVWRLDLGDQIDGGAADDGGSSGARLAILADGADDKHKRKFFFAPDVIQVSDALFSDVSEYDLVTIISGDRENPLETTVLNRAYALRDYAVSEPLVEGGLFPLGHDRDGDGDGDPDLYDATDNFVQVGDEGQKDAAVTGLKNSNGWFIDLAEQPGDVRIGEKGLASPIVLAGKLFFTTFVPGETADPCQAVEGFGRLYGIDALTGAAEFDDWGGSDDNAFETADRVYTLGGGIPSSAVPIFQKQGVTLLIGTGGGAESVDPDIDLPRVRTYWYDE